MKAATSILFVLAMGVAAAPHASAAAAQDGARDKPAARSDQATAAAERSEGEIRKVDKEAGKVTIRHGPLKNLGMPAMTMAFRVKAPALLDQVKAGDKISFVADKTGNQLIVVQMQVKR